VDLKLPLLWAGLRDVKGEPGWLGRAVGRIMT
jgi:hypothetical protein